MAQSFDPGALLSHVYTLADGLKVRLRLIQRQDQEAIRALFRQRGREPEDFELARLMRFDSQRLAICAIGLLQGAPTVLGVGSIRLDEPWPEDQPEPELVLVDERIGEELEELLRGALCGRARAIVSGRAA